MNIGDKYIVDIIDVDNNGNGIAKVNNFVIFIQYALLNEKVEIEIISINKRFANGKIINIIESSKDRINVKCPYYYKCGGCNFLHTNYDNEINIKKSYVEKLFNRKVTVLDNKIISNYRNKVTLHVLEGKLGYFNDKTHTLCEIDHCDLLSHKINLKISDLSNYDLSNINEIMIRCISNEIMINIKGNNINKKLYDIECDSLYINDKFIKGKEYLIDEINDLKYSIYPNSFYQVNKEGMNNIYNKVYEYINESNNLIDLYCGTGTIGIWVNNKAKNIIGIEINESSIMNANINKELNNLSNIEFKLGDANIVKEYINDIDTIIVDPPRSGLSKRVTDILNNSLSKSIIYVSCNPNTLKRDIDLLSNYEIKDISICNMFPRTKHVESVVVLERIDKYK